MRRHLRLPSPAMVVALIALLFSLGTGGAVALNQISGSTIKDRSIPGKKLKRNSVGRDAIREGSLRIVPEARRLNGLTAKETLQRCPDGTYLAAGACVDRGWRPREQWFSALLTCALAGRRLPLAQELLVVVARPDVALAPEGELVSETADPAPDGTIVAKVIQDESAAKMGKVPNTPAGAMPFRCASEPRDNQVLDPPR